MSIAWKAKGNNMTIEQLETQAYLAGDTYKAELLARIADLELQISDLTDKLDSAESDSLARWERNNGPAYEYVQFFHECFDRLGSHYPCPEISNDHDKSIIYAAIERGEGVTE